MEQVLACLPAEKGTSRRKKRAYDEFLRGEYAMMKTLDHIDDPRQALLRDPALKKQLGAKWRVLKANNPDEVKVLEAAARQ
eukprot:15454908-Alexandrium_andersonii.AAC.1